MAPRSVIIAAYALVAVSLWSPSGIDLTPSPAWEFLRYALFGMCAAFIVLHTVLSQGIAISRSPEWLLLAAFILYTALSAIWSDGGANAIIKGGLLFTALLVSICMANAIGLSGVLRIFYNSMVVFIFLSILVVIFLPERGVQTGWLLEGDWRGIASQKNGLGMVSSLVLVASLALPVKPFRGVTPTLASYCARLAVIVAASVCAVNSGSRGALVIAVIGLCLVGAARLPGSVQRVGLVVLALATLPLIWLVAVTLDFRADLIDVLGQTIDSNGRMTLWLYGLTQLGGRELLGFGVEGFWTMERIIAFRDLHGWVLDNFHNGYVTILVEGGVVGLGLLMLALAFLLLLYVVAVGSVRDGYIALALAYTGMFLVGNMTENEIGRSTSLNFIIFLSTSFALRARVEEVASKNARHGRIADGGGNIRPSPTFS